MVRWCIKTTVNRKTKLLVEPKKYLSFLQSFYVPFARCRGEDETHLWEKEEGAACRWHAVVVVRGNRNDEKKGRCQGTVICPTGTNSRRSCTHSVREQRYSTVLDVIQAFRSHLLDPSSQFYIFCAVPWVLAMIRDGLCRVSRIFQSRRVN